jgi:hypothetical protein
MDYSSITRTTATGLINLFYIFYNVLLCAEIIDAAGCNIPAKL